MAHEISRHVRQAIREDTLARSADLFRRMNPRRLNSSAIAMAPERAAAWMIGGRACGRSGSAGQHTATVYGRIARDKVNTMLQLYDFRPPTMHSPQRESTTSPLQQLFIMNSPFVQDRAEAIARSVEQQPDAGTKIRELYRRIFVRDPSADELQLAEQFLKTSTVTNCAQALLATNEVIFWP